MARRAQAEQRTASAPWAAPPSVELAYRDDRLQTNTGTRESEIGVAMPLWLPGQRAARQSAADAELAVATVAEVQGRLRVADAVRELLWQIAELRAEVGLAQAQARSLEALANDVDRRVAAGDLARADALAARGEILGAQASLSQTQVRLQVATRQWTALTGLERIPATGSADIEPVPAPTTEEHPALRMASHEVDLARKRLELTNASKRSPPELIARLRQDVGGRGEPAVNTFGLGVRIPLGTADRNEPLMAAALTELEVAEAKQRQKRETISASMANAKTTAEAAERQLQGDRSRAAMLRERATLVENSFRAGETSLPELLRASSAAAQAEANLARQEAALGLARARLQQAFGQLP